MYAAAPSWHRITFIGLQKDKARRRDVDVKLDVEDAPAALRHRQRSREEPRVTEEEAGDRCHSLHVAPSTLGLNRTPADPTPQYGLGGHITGAHELRNEVGKGSGRVKK